MPPKQSKFELILGAKDSWSRPWGKFQKALDAGEQKLERLREASARLGKETGLSRFLGAARGMGAAFNASLDRAKASFGALSGIGAKLGVAFGLAGGGIAALTYQIAGLGNEAVKMSQKAGLGVESWQKWAHAAGESGADADQLRDSFANLNEKTIEAAQGNKDAVAWFRRAGVQIKSTNGKLKSSEELYLELADAVKKLTDSGQLRKAEALAKAMFGEEGAVNLLPMLRQGAAGINALRNEAEELGLVLSEKNAEAAENFLNRLSGLKNLALGFAINLGSKLIPLLDALAADFQGWAKANREVINAKLQEFVEFLRQRLPKIKDTVLKVGAAMLEFGKKIAKVADFLGWEKTLALGLAALAAVIAGPLIAATLSFGAALLATPIGWVIAGIAGVTAAVILLYKNWDKVAAWFKGLWTDIKNAFSRSWLEGIVHVLENFTPLGWIKKGMDTVLEYFTGLSLRELGEKLLGTLWDGLKSGWDKVKGWLSDAVGGGGVGRGAGDGVFATPAVQPSGGRSDGGSPFGPPLGAAAMAANSSPAATTHTEKQEMELKLVLPPGMQAQSLDGNVPSNLDVRPQTADTGRQMTF